MSDEEEPDGGQDGEDEVGPGVLHGGAVERRGGEEVAEQDQVNDRSDDVHQDLRSTWTMSRCPQRSTLSYSAVQIVLLEVARILHFLVTSSANFL